MFDKMLPPPEVGATFYRFEHVSAGGSRIKMDWVRYSVRAVVDRESYTVGDDPKLIDGYQLVVRHWTIKRGWNYSLFEEYSWSADIAVGRILVVDAKPSRPWNDGDAAREGTG
jgi:hypothetical protein